jgi:hypothetical protein
VRERERERQSRDSVSSGSSGARTHGSDYVVSVSGPWHILQDTLPQFIIIIIIDSLYSLVVRVPGYRYRVPGSIPGATRFSEK